MNQGAKQKAKNRFKHILEKQKANKEFTEEKWDINKEYNLSIHDSNISENEIIVNPENIPVEHNKKLELNFFIQDLKIIFSVKRDNSSFFKQSKGPISIHTKIYELIKRNNDITNLNKLVCNVSYANEELYHLNSICINVNQNISVHAVLLGHFCEYLKGKVLYDNSNIKLPNCEVIYAKIAKNGLESEKLKTVLSGVATHSTNYIIKSEKGILYFLIEVSRDLFYFSSSFKTKLELCLEKIKKTFTILKENNSNHKINIILFSRVFFNANTKKLLLIRRNKAIDNLINKTSYPLISELDYFIDIYSSILEEKLCHIDMKILCSFINLAIKDFLIKINVGNIPKELNILTDYNLNTNSSVNSSRKINIKDEDNDYTNVVRKAKPSSCFSTNKSLLTPTFKKCNCSIRNSKETKDIILNELFYTFSFLPDDSLFLSSSNYSNWNECINLTLNEIKLQSSVLSEYLGSSIILISSGENFPFYFPSLLSFTKDLVSETGVTLSMFFLTNKLKFFKINHLENNYIETKERSYSTYSIKHDIKDLKFKDQQNNDDVDNPIIMHSFHNKSIQKEEIKNIKDFYTSTHEQYNKTHKHPNWFQIFFDTIDTINVKNTHSHIIERPNHKRKLSVNSSTSSCNEQYNNYTSELIDYSLFNCKTSKIKSTNNHYDQLYYKNQEIIALKPKSIKDLPIVNIKNINSISKLKLIYNLQLDEITAPSSNKSSFFGLEAINNNVVNTPKQKIQSKEYLPLFKENIEESNQNKSFKVQSSNQNITKDKEELSILLNNYDSNIFNIKKDSTNNNNIKLFTSNGSNPLLDNDIQVSNLIDDYDYFIQSITNILIKPLFGELTEDLIHEEKNFSPYLVSTMDGEISKIKELLVCNRLNSNFQILKNKSDSEYSLSNTNIIYLFDRSFIHVISVEDENCKVQMYLYSENIKQKNSNENRMLKKTINYNCAIIDLKGSFINLADVKINIGEKDYIYWSNYDLKTTEIKSNFINIELMYHLNLCIGYYKDGQSPRNSFSLDNKILSTNLDKDKFANLIDWIVNYLENNSKNDFNYKKIFNKIEIQDDANKLTDIRKINNKQILELITLDNQQDSNEIIYYLSNKTVTKSNLFYFGFKWNNSKHLKIRNFIYNLKKATKIYGLMLFNLPDDSIVKSIFKRVKIFESPFVYQLMYSNTITSLLTSYYFCKIDDSKVFYYNYDYSQIICFISSTGSYRKGMIYIYQTNEGNPEYFIDVVLLLNKILISVEILNWIISLSLETKR